MKRPLLLVASFYAGGLLLADFSPVPLPVFPLLTATAGMALLAIAWPKARVWLLWTLLVFTGAANLVCHTSVLSPHDVRIIVGERPAIALVRGRLPVTPYHRVYEHNEEATHRSLAELEVTEMRLQGGNWQPAFGHLVVSTPGLVPAKFFAGRRIEIEGVIRKPNGPLAPGLFDYAKYLNRQGIYYQVQVASPDDWRLLEKTEVTRPLGDQFSDWGQGILALGLPTEDEPLRLLWAMTLGWKTALTSEVSEPFMRSGTMHVFAISGLHIALISGILVAALRVFRVPRFICGLIVIPLIWSYTAVTGWQASAIRSAIMMSVIIAGWSLRRPSDLLNSLGAAAFIILMWDPQQLFQASFQLSFFVVLSLALFIPVLDTMRQRWLKEDPLVPAGLRPRWQRWSKAPLRFFTASLMTSLAAWLGSIPLIAYYFHLFNPVSLLANLIVVPLSSAALASNMGSLAVGAWCPGAAELFNNSAWFFMWLMVRVSEWAAHLPGGCINIAPPSLLGLALYCFFLVSVMAGWLVRPRLRVWIVGGIILLGLLWTGEWRSRRSANHVTILPLNGGEVIYCQSAGNGLGLLIDCGDKSSAEFVLKPFLRAQGLSHLDALLLTHGNIHNVGGAKLVEAAFRPRQVFFSDISFRSAAYREAKKIFSASGNRTKILCRGDTIGPWIVLHPSHQTSFPQADDNTFVLHGDVGGVRILLLSDLGKPGQSALLSRKLDLRAVIIVSGVPAQSEPLADALLREVQPQLIIVTDSDYPAAARATRKLRERLAHSLIPTLYTRETGGLTLTTRRGIWEVIAADGTKLAEGTSAGHELILPPPEDRE
jgi:competence protein ComEC